MTAQSKTTALTRLDIAERVYEEVGLSKQESAALVNDLFDHLTTALTQGQKVKISNFGTFGLAAKKERMARNPKTGEPAIVSKRKVVTFKASPRLLWRINAKPRGKPHER